MSSCGSIVIYDGSRQGAKAIAYNFYLSLFNVEEHAYILKTYQDAIYTKDLCTVCVHVIVVTRSMGYAIASSLLQVAFNDPASSCVEQEWIDGAICERDACAV